MHRRTACLALSLLLPGGILLTSAHARSDSVSLPRSVSRDFHKGIAHLAEEMRCAVVAEGVPLFPTLTPEECDAIPTTGDAESLLDKFASAYDYRVLRTENGKRPFPSTVILQKRYTHPSDMPCVSFEECLAFARDAEAAYRRNAPNPPVSSQTDLVMGVLETFSPEQLSALEKGGIPVRSLSDTQRDMIWRMAGHLYTMDIQRSALIRLTQANSGTLREVTESVSGRYITRLKMVYLALRMSQLMPGEQVINQRPLKRPGPESVSLWQTPSPRISDALPRISALGKQTLTVEPELSRKPLLLIGERYSDTGTITRSIGKLYDLRVLTTDNKAYSLKRKRIPPNVSLENLYTAIRDALPLPILRAFAPSTDQEATLKRLKDEREQILRARPASAEEGQRNYRRLREIDDRIDEIEGEDKNHPNLLVQELNRQLRFGALRNLEGKDKAKGVDFPRLDERTRILYAISVLGGVEQSVQKLPSVPFFIRQFDAVVLSGGPMADSDKPYFELSLNRVGENGRLEMLGGLEVPDRRPKK